MSSPMTWSDNNDATYRQSYVAHWLVGTVGWHLAIIISIKTESDGVYGRKPAQAVLRVLLNSLPSTFSMPNLGR